MRSRFTALLLLITGSAFSQEHAHLLKQEVTYTLESSSAVEIEENYTLKILSEKGNTFAVYREYVDDFRKLTDVTIDVYNKDGQKVKRVKKGDGHEFGFSSSYEISSGKVFVLNPDFKDYPYTLEVKTKLKINGFTSLPPWVPRAYFNLGVTEANFSIIYPESLAMRFKEEHIKSE